MNIAVIFAGGVGARMNSKDRPKQFLELYNKPIIIHTLDVFERSKDIDAIVISCVEGWIPYLEELIYRFRIEKVRKVVPGGATGQLSIYNGLQAAKEVAGEEEAIVLIHDGVRPNISPELIRANIDSVLAHGSSISGATATETPAEIDADGMITNVSPRDCAVIAKAPQSFLLKDIYAAHKKAQSEGLNNFIDSATMMRHYGYRLHVVPCRWDNIKITTPSDFYIFRAILEAQENSQFFSL